MVTKKTTKASLTVEAFKHDEGTRKNISTAEYQSQMKRTKQDWRNTLRSIDGENFHKMEPLQ